MKLKGNNLIIVNILATYGRILLSAIMMLFSTRWVLKALGKDDFGLYSVVGGLIVFILFIGNTMVVSVQRFFAYAIGQGNPEEVKKWFNTALILHAGFSALLVVIGIPVGNYLLDHVMNIPPERLATCHWVYYLSIFGAVASLISIPSIAMFTAKQRIFELSFWNTMHIVLVFLLALILLHLQRLDLLLAYSVGMVGCKFLRDLSLVIRARIIFSECTIKKCYFFNKERIKKLISFSGWRLFGGLGTMLKNQGLALLLNVYGNSRINAAFGLANQLNAQTSTISGAVYNALSPEIISREGAGNRNGMISLSLRTTKFVMLLTFFWAIPLISEMDSVLGLWLEEIPEYASIFCKLVILAYIADQISIGYIGAIYAKGEIAGYQILLGGLHILTFPLGWLVLKFGGGYVWTVSCILLTSACVGFGRVLWVRKIIGTPVLRWFKEVFLKLCFVLIPTCFVIYFIRGFIEISLWRVVVIAISNMFLVCIFSWSFSLSKDERDFIKDKVFSIIKYMRIA